MASCCQGRRLCCCCSSRCAAPAQGLALLCLQRANSRSEESRKALFSLFFLLFFFPPGLTFSLSGCDLAAAEPLGCWFWQREGPGVAGFSVPACIPHASLNLPVHICSGDGCLKPVPSRCELQGAAHRGFTSAEFGFLLSPDCQIPLQTNVNGIIPKECFRLTERIVGCLFSNKHLPESVKTKEKVNLGTSHHHTWVFEARGLHHS